MNAGQSSSLTLNEHTVEKNYSAFFTCLCIQTFYALVLWSAFWNAFRFTVVVKSGELSLDNWLIDWLRFDNYINFQIVLLQQG